MDLPARFDLAAVEQYLSVEHMERNRDYSIKSARRVSGGYVYFFIKKIHDSSDNLYKL
jgi:hypothetical protein